MIKKKMQMLLLAAIVAAGMVSGNATVHAEEGSDSFNYLDAWDDIRGNDVEQPEEPGKKEELAESGKKEEVASDSLTDMTEDFGKAEENQKGGESDSIDQDTFDQEKDSEHHEGDMVGDYISSDLTVDTPATPDMDITFDVNGDKEDNPGLFTPDGNLTLVDDLDEGNAQTLQYMTVQTKDGATFYIIIDRSTDDDNVYFLNTVDAADLMALMDDETKAGFEEQIEKDAKAKEEAAKKQAAEAGGDAGKEKDTAKKDSGINLLALFGIFAVLGGVAFAYYNFKIKPQKQDEDDDDDLEFMDDEEVENEDEDEEENGQAGYENAEEMPEDDDEED